jgi:hypothetical protein
MEESREQCTVVFALILRNQLVSVRVWRVEGGCYTPHPPPVSLKFMQRRQWIVLQTPQWPDPTQGLLVS